MLEEEGLLSLLLRILLVRSHVEPAGHEHHSVVLHAVLIGPFLRLEEALYRDHGTFCEAVEGVTVLVHTMLREGMGAIFLYSVQTHWAYHIIFALAKIYKNLAKIKEGSAVSGHNRLKGIIFVRLLQIFVSLMKRQENSEFWCTENRAEVTKRMMAGKYASFEPLSANC